MRLYWGYILWEGNDDTYQGLANKVVIALPFGTTVCPPPFRSISLATYPACSNSDWHRTTTATTQGQKVPLYVSLANSYMYFPQPCTYLATYVMSDSMSRTTNSHVCHTTILCTANVINVWHLLLSWFCWCFGSQYYAKVIKTLKIKRDVGMALCQKPFQLAKSRNVGMHTGQGR